jgi:hypothetical protein
MLADAMTFRVTGMVTGLFADCADVITTDPLYVPGPRLARFEALMFTEVGVVPLAAPAISQLPPLVVDVAVVKFTGTPLDVTVNACAAGALDPMV